MQTRRNVEEVLEGACMPRSSTCCRHWLRSWIEWALSLVMITSPHSYPLESTHFRFMLLCTEVSCINPWIPKEKLVQLTITLHGSPQHQVPCSPLTLQGYASHYPHLSASDHCSKGNPLGVFLGLFNLIRAALLALLVSESLTTGIFRPITSTVQLSLKVSPFHIRNVFQVPSSVCGHSFGSSPSPG